MEPQARYRTPHADQRTRPAARQEGVEGTRARARSRGAGAVGRTTREQVSASTADDEGISTVGPASSLTTGADQADGTDTPDSVAFAPLQSPALYLRVVKPVFDRLVAVVLLVVLAPALLAGMAAVRMTLGKGVFFTQQRVGLDGKIFSTYKLRTMDHDRRNTSEADEAAFAAGMWDGFDRRRTHKSEDDPRLNRVGRALRTFSIDEIPQLFNILLGDMSLVGPRPEIPGVVAKHYQPWMHRRHVVKPGLTGLWQVSERGNGMMHEHVDVDLDYVDSIGLWTDLRILLMTPFAVVTRRGY
jgi:lipopolysaccharide/colanic/teichoic acid biosynthesis glycosyltransferase